MKRKEEKKGDGGVVRRRCPSVHTYTNFNPKVDTIAVLHNDSTFINPVYSRE